jgi:DNA-binding NtrC family response regulator
MHTVGPAPLDDETTSRVADDEGMAACSTARLLITADAPGQAEALARRLHAASMRGRSPFVRFEARELPVDSRMLRHAFSDAVDAGDVGTVFIDNVEEMPSAVQDALIELLTELGVARAASVRARIVTGTTHRCSIALRQGHSLTSCSIG